MKLPATAFISILLCCQACAEPLFQDGAYIGVWYFVDGDEKIHPQESLQITKAGSSFFVIYKTGTNAFKGEFKYRKDGRAIEGLLNGYGQVILSPTRAVSEFLNGAVGMDQANEFENIEIGFFQKKEVLEKLLKRKLP